MADEPDIETTDEDFIAASNLDVAKRLPNDQIEPEPEPTPRPENPYANTPYTPVYGSDPLNDSNLQRSNDPNTTSNLGDGSEPLNERISTPLDAELDTITMQHGQQTPQETADTATAAGSNNTSNTDSNNTNASGFSKLSQVENKQ